MRPENSRMKYVILGGAILLVVLIAGCTTSPNGTPPTTTQTPVVTATTPMATPPATTAPVTPTTAATTPPVTTATPTETTPTGAPVAVTIQNFAFSPAAVTVPKGTTVTWTNQDSPSHTIVSDATSQKGAGQIFMSNTLGRGQSYSFTFTESGTFPYHCGIHPSMKGTITVT